MLATTAADEVAARAPTGFTVYLGVVTVVHLGHFLAESTRVLGVLPLQWPGDYVGVYGEFLLALAVAVPMLALALQVLDRATPSGMRAAHRFAAAAVLMLVASSGAAALYAYVFNGGATVRLGAAASEDGLFWYALWKNIVVGSLALVALDYLRARRQAFERLAAVREQSRRARRHLAQSQLQAIQARVDPGLLFDMLAAVKRFYVGDAARAERLLDELSVFLRAALPRLRSARSSLEVEFALVARYVRLEQTASDRVVRFEMPMPESLPAAVFPAGVLLPLTMSLLRDRRGGCSIGLAAAQDERTIRVRVSTLRAPPESTLARLRNELADLYGGHASLRVMFDPDAADARSSRTGVSVEMEVPRESE
jgi:hypothetical protein